MKHLRPFDLMTPARFDDEDEFTLNLNSQPSRSSPLFLPIDFDVEQREVSTNATIARWVHFSGTVRCARLLRWPGACRLSLAGCSVPHWYPRSRHRIPLHCRPVPYFCYSVATSSYSLANPFPVRVCVHLSLDALVHLLFSSFSIDQAEFKPITAGAHDARCLRFVLRSGIMCPCRNGPCTSFS